MKTTVIYHRADFDGIFCREIAKKFLPASSTTSIGWDYGDPVPEVSLDENLYILDLSIDPLMEHPNLNWIDHHKSAIKKYPNTPGYQIDGVAACRLTWQWFTHCSEEHGLPVLKDYIDRAVEEPEAVRLAGEYDVWDKRDPNAELFQHGLRSRELTEIWWARMLRCDDKEAVFELLKGGEAIKYAKEQGNNAIIQNYGYTIDWMGLKFLAINHARFNSQLFIAGLKPEHDACLGWNYTGKEFRVSLYHAPGKEHHDLSKIAEAFGGGGHRGACGFSCKTLPWA